MVGESGCGKTTTAKTILRLEDPTEGQVMIRLDNQGDQGWEVKNVHELKGQDVKEYRSTVQAVFQDPWSSLSPANANP